MKKHLVFFIFTWVITLPFYAIDYFEKGYIVTLENDTVYGYIERLSESKLSVGVIFNDTILDTTVFYMPDQLSAFGFADGINFSPVLYKHTVNSFGGTEKISQTCFAKRLMTGDISLYKLQLTSIEGDHVYILRKGDEYYTIRENLNVLNQPEGMINRRDVGILIFLLEPCPEEKEKVGKTKFDDKEMIALLSRYSTCAAPEVEQATFNYRVKKKYTFLLDAGYTGLFTSDEYINGGELGILCDVYSPHLSENTSFITGLQFFYYSNYLKDEDGNEEFENAYFFKIPLLVNTNLYRGTNKRSFDFQVGLNYVFPVFINFQTGISCRYKQMRLAAGYEMYLMTLLTDESFIQSCFLSAGYYF